MTTEKLQVKLELNHKAAYREKPTPEGFTHDWMVTVRGPNGSEIEHFVEKVVFYLHESFKKPKRSVKAPAYSIAESGYAGFTLPIDVCFRNKDEPKKITFMYDLFLHAQGCPPVNNTRCEKLTFENPTPEFRSKLLKAGAYVLDLNHQSPTNIPVVGGPTPDLSIDVKSKEISSVKSSSDVKKIPLKTEKSDVHKISTESKKSSSSSHEMKKPMLTPNSESKKTQELKKSPKPILKVDPEFADLFGAPIKPTDIDRSKEKSFKSKDHKDKKSSVDKPKSDKDSHSRDSSKHLKSTPDARKEDTKKHEKSSSSSRDNDKDQNGSASKSKNRPSSSGQEKSSKDGRSSKTEDRSLSKERSTHSDPGKDKKRESSSVKPKGDKDRSNVAPKHAEEKKKYPKSEKPDRSSPPPDKRKPDRSSPPPDKRKPDKVKKDEKLKETPKEKVKEKKHSDKPERSDSRMSGKEKEKSERKEKRDSKDEKKSRTVDKEKEKSRSRESLVRSSSRESEVSKHSESKHESKSSHRHRSKSPDRREENIKDEKRRREEKKNSKDSRDSRDSKDSKHRKSEHKKDIPHQEKTSSSKDRERAFQQASVKSEKKEFVKVKEEKPAPKTTPKKSPAKDPVVKKPVKIMEKLESLFSTGENSDDDPFENGGNKPSSSESDDQKSNASSFAKLKVKDNPLRKLMKQAHESDSDPESPLSPPPEDTKPFNKHSPLKREDTRGFSPRSEKKSSTSSEAERKYESPKKRRSSIKSESPPKRPRTPSVDEAPTDPRLKPRSDSVRKTSFGSDFQSDKESKQSIADIKQEPQISESSSSGSSDSENSDNEEIETKIKVEKNAVEFTEEYLIELVKIQQKLMASRDRDLVQKVVDLVGQTDCFDVDVAFNFDLCSLDKRTVHRIRDLLQCVP